MNDKLINNKSNQLNGKYKYTILLAEDDYEMRKMLSWLLKQRGYLVEECVDGIILLNKIKKINKELNENQFDLIIADDRMPGFSGLEVFEKVKRYNELPPIIIITAYPTKKTFEMAKTIGIKEIFSKPFNLGDLVISVMKYIPHH